MPSHWSQNEESLLTKKNEREKGREESQGGGRRRMARGAGQTARPCSGTQHCLGCASQTPKLFLPTPLERPGLIATWSIPPPLPPQGLLPNPTRARGKGKPCTRRSSARATQCRLNMKLLKIPSVLPAHTNTCPGCVGCVLLTEPRWFGSWKGWLPCWPVFPQAWSPPHLPAVSRTPAHLDPEQLEMVPSLRWTISCWPSNFPDSCRG